MLNAILAGAGAFASRKPIPKAVKLPTADGDIDVTLYFLDLPAGEVQEILKADGAENPEFIVRVLCNEDGSPALEMDGEHGAKALKLQARAAIAKAGLEALGLTKPAKVEAKND